MMMARPGRGGGGCGSRWPGLSPPDCQTDQPPSASADRIHLSQLQLLQPPTNQPAPHGTSHHRQMDTTASNSLSTKTGSTTIEISSETTTTHSTPTQNVKQ
ncbi:hypothetical protein BaRGS_00004671 [Batillaria attramentaria]|uniref:Uncharacterized protein n=1 Tax=Batillaria attramentaria TaxID=370345 RepID=A0ABD0LWG5_9CAEN